MIPNEFWLHLEIPQRYEVSSKKAPNQNLISKNKKLNVRWFDSVPGTSDFQAVKFTSEVSRRNQPRLST